MRPPILVRVEAADAEGAASLVEALARALARAGLRVEVDGALRKEGAPTVRLERRIVRRNGVRACVAVVDADAGPQWVSPLETGPNPAEALEEILRFLVTWGFVPRLAAARLES